MTPVFRAGYLTGYNQKQAEDFGDKAAPLTDAKTGKVIGRYEPYKQAQQAQATVVEPKASASLPAGKGMAAKAVGAGKALVGSAGEGPTGEVLTGADKAGLKARAMGVGTAWGEGEQPTAAELKASRMHNLANHAVAKAPRLADPADVSQADSGLPLAKYLTDAKILFK